MPDHTTSASITTVSASASPASAVRVARIGGTIAELAAAAISAHTLFHLGRQLDLGPATAWLLPAALDVYAFTAMAVGYNLPSHHPGQRIVLRNARLAFAMTLGANGLDHFLTKAGQLIDPTVRDLLLVTVATLPPLVVERLLNLQSLLVGNRATTGDQNNRKPLEPRRRRSGRGQGHTGPQPGPGRTHGHQPPSDRTAGGDRHSEVDRSRPTPRLDFPRCGQSSPSCPLTSAAGRQHASSRRRSPARPEL